MPREVAARANGVTTTHVTPCVLAARVASGVAYSGHWTKAHSNRGEYAHEHSLGPSIRPGAFYNGQCDPGVQ